MMYRRSPMIPGIVILVIVAIAVAIALTSGSSGGSGVTTTSSTATTNVNESVAKVDDQDPNQSGCAATGEYLPGISVPVIAPNGAPRGKLVLRRSTACQAIWGRVNGLEGHSRYLVEINLYRPSDRKQLFFNDADSATYVFSNMLSERPGCVYATAYLEQGKQRGLTARTPCR